MFIPTIFAFYTANNMPFHLYKIVVAALLVSTASAQWGAFRNVRNSFSRFSSQNSATAARIAARVEAAALALPTCEAEKFEVNLLKATITSLKGKISRRDVAAAAARTAARTAADTIAALHDQLASANAALASAARTGAPGFGTAGAVVAAPAEATVWVDPNPNPCCRMFINSGPEANSCRGVGRCQIY